jgi:DNA-binding NarL/FixJ family response regulator
MLNGTRAAVAGDELPARRVATMLRRAGVEVGATVRQPADLEDADADVGVVISTCGPLERPAALAALCRRRPRLPVVAVLPAGEAPAVREALAAGARGCVTEQELETALAPTVQAVLAGQVCVPAVGRQALGRVALSARERDALELVARGLQNVEIGKAMFLSESTVKSHLMTAFRKLGVRSRAEAAAIVRDPERRPELGLPPLAA